MQSAWEIGAAGKEVQLLWKQLQALGDKAWVLGCSLDDLILKISISRKMSSGPKRSILDTLLSITLSITYILEGNLQPSAPV